MPSTTHKITFSAGYDTSKIRTYRTLFGYYRKNTAYGVRDAHLFKRATEVLRKYTNKKPGQARVLEIGSGQRFPIALLFHSLGARVTGIDTDVVGPWLSWNRIRDGFKINGFERSIKTLVRHALFDRAYYNALAETAGVLLRTTNLDLQIMNAQRMTFASNTFDMIFSHAVFEHIADVNKAAKEAARVLKKGGVAYLQIDLFPHLSGGHHLDWAFPDESASKTVPAWDHLRGNKFPTHVYLNKLAEKEYLKIFSNYFVIMDNEPIYEGKKFLTPALRKELKKYSVEDLTKKSIRLTLRKK